MTDVEIIKLARSSATVYANGERTESTEEAVIAAYQADCLGDEIYEVRRDMWRFDQEVIYRLAYAWQLVALGL